MLALLALAVTAAQPAASTPIPTDPSQRITCHREVETGSLASSRKVCHTVADWRKMADDAQDAVGKMVEQGAICTTCQGR